MQCGDKPTLGVPQFAWMQWWQSGGGGGGDLASCCSPGSRRRQLKSHNSRRSGPGLPSARPTWVAKIHQATVLADRFCFSIGGGSWHQRRGGGLK